MMFPISICSNYHQVQSYCIESANMSGGSRGKAKDYHPDLNLIGQSLTDKIKSADAVIISDYGKGFVTNELISLTRESASFVSVDPKQVVFSVSIYRIF